MKTDKVLDVSNIEGIDKIVFTPVSYFSGPQESLIFKKDEYPQFDNLLSKLKINKYSYRPSYTLVEFYKGTKLIIKGYLEYFKAKEMWEAINQAKEWLKQKQKL